MKPLFLDVAWNYVTYPGKGAGGGGVDQQQTKESSAAAPPVAAEPQPEAKPQKRGWFGFGRS